MSLLNPLSWRLSKTYRAWPPAKKLRQQINDRQAKVEGYALDAFRRASICAIGAGGVGIPILQGLSMKGVRHVDIYDDDRVELSNLSRLPQFSIADVGKYKAHVAARRLTAGALFPLTVTAHPFRFEERLSIDRPPKRRSDLIICGVDNNPTRRDVSAFAIAHRIPVIFAAVGRDANAASVFVQEPDHACWGCAYPQMLNDQSYPCGLPGSIDVLNVAAGLAIHAADSLIASRPREWNRRDIYLDGGLSDRTLRIERRPYCPLCAEAAAVVTSLPQAA